MKCPMLMYNYLPNESPTEGVHSDCLQAECAWWYTDGARCCILDLDITLMNMECELADIEKHMAKRGRP